MVIPEKLLRRRTLLSSTTGSHLSTNVAPNSGPRSTKKPFHLKAVNFSALQNPRLQEFGPVIYGQFASLHAQYKAPQNPIVLAHGLFGFDELHIAGPKLPGVHYWRGIAEALRSNGIEVFTTNVPASESIENRAQKLAEQVDELAHGRQVNIIAHSMGGLDSRYMISRIRPSSVKVASLTTIATPHHGSAFADYIFRRIGAAQLPKVYKALEHFGISTGAFSELTRDYMQHKFNKQVPDLENVKYFSYGAAFHEPPPFYSLFRQSYYRVLEAEGPNDGLVSVRSSQWGEYQGTLSAVSHLDLINWTNRLRWLIWQISGNKINFNAIAFYLHISDMLAKRGL